MKVNKKPKGLPDLADSIGDFIRYWGFRRIHGQIWTMVYLSTSPLSGAELAASLKVSKALISPALKELEKYRLVIQIESENSKTKRYGANPDIFQVIKDVLISREMEILHKVSSNFAILNRVTTATGDLSIDPARLADLGEMVKSANAFLGAIVRIESSDTLRGLAMLVSGDHSE